MFLWNQVPINAENLNIRVIYVGKTVKDCIYFKNKYWNVRSGKYYLVNEKVSKSCL